MSRWCWSCWWSHILRTTKERDFWQLYAARNSDDNPTITQENTTNSDKCRSERKKHGAQTVESRASGIYGLTGSCSQSRQVWTGNRLGAWLGRGVALRRRTYSGRERGDAAHLQISVDKGIRAKRSGGSASGGVGGSIATARPGSARPGGPRGGSTRLESQLSRATGPQPGPPRPQPGPVRETPPAHIPPTPRQPSARWVLATMYFRSFLTARSRVTCSFPASRCASWISGGSCTRGPMATVPRPHDTSYLAAMPGRVAWRHMPAPDSVGFGVTSRSRGSLSSTRSDVTCPRQPLPGRTPPSPSGKAP